MKCKLFGCVYATRRGCSVDGHVSKEGPLNGTKNHCPHYDVKCINAKCKYCRRRGGDDCKGVIMQVSSDTYLFYEWLIIDKKMTEEKFKQLTVSQVYALQTEYNDFKKGLRGL